MSVITIPQGYRFTWAICHLKPQPSNPNVPWDYRGDVIEMSDDLEYLAKKYLGRKDIIFTRELIKGVSIDGVIKARPPRKHVLSITYKPKIKKVFSGKCCQTIRKGDKWLAGDSVLFHTWSGRPYATPWGKRLQVTLIDVFIADVNEDGMLFMNEPSFPMRLRWDSDAVGMVAHKDGIEGAKDDNKGGTLLRDVLKSHGKDWQGVYSILQWRVTKKDDDENLLTIMSNNTDR